MHTSKQLCSAALAVFVIACSGQRAHASEGGVSFWLPGQFGSLAATPGQPGWAFATVYYHTTVDASAGKNFRFGGGVQSGINARADLVFLNANYVFATPMLGAQAAFGLTTAYGRSQAGINATLTGPFGNSVSGHRTDVLEGFSDLYPLASLKWNFGVHNVMLYTMWDLPVGAYDPTRLANIGIGHWAMDYGAGYTYYNPATGHELSAVTGFSYSFKNPYTDYQNGIDWHLDWAFSKFLSKKVHVGVVGYFLNQLTGDSGSGATLGDFKSRVAGIGPQLGYLFPVGDKQGYLNLKGYYEYDSENRPRGWNVWLTFAISPEAKTTAKPPKMRN